MKQLKKLERLSDKLEEVLGIEIPIVIPPDTFVGGDNIGGFEFNVWVFSSTSTPSLGTVEPYVKYRYVNPRNKNDYIFCSSYLYELVEYLKEFGLLEQSQPEVDRKEKDASN